MLECRSRRTLTLTIRERRARPIASATVTVEGREVAVRRRAGRHTAAIDLRGTRRTTVRVRITVRYADGGTHTSVRRYRTCRAKLGPSNGLGRAKAL